MGGRIHIYFRHVNAINFCDSSSSNECCHLFESCCPSDFKSGKVAGLSKKLDVI